MNNNILTIALLTAFLMFGLMASDILVPSLPHIVQAMNTTAEVTKMTVSIYVLGLSLASLVFGPMSDRYGRRPLILAGVMMAILGSLLSIVAMNIQFLLLTRFVQSLGFGGVLSVTRVVGNDLFEGKTLAKVAGMMSLSASFGPAVAPIVGGYLHAHFGWRSVFILVSACVLPLGIIIYHRLVETASQLNPQATALKTMAMNYMILMKNKHFWGYMIASSFSIAALIVYASLSPFILQQTYHLSPIHFGWTMAAVTVMTIISRFMNVRLLRFYSPAQIVKIGLMLMALGSGAMMILSALNVHFLMAIIIPAMVMILGTGAVPSNAMVLVFKPYRHISGSVSALYGCFAMLGGFLATLLASYVPNTVMYLSLLLSGMSAVAITVLMVSTREPRNTLPTPSYTT